MFAGFDFGTSGARTIVIDSDRRVQFEAKVSYSLPDETTWQPALHHLIKKIPMELRRSLKALAIDGTSGTFIGCDQEGNVKTPVQLYNDPRGRTALAFLRTITNHSVVLSSTSTLARLVNLRHQGQWEDHWQLVHHCDRVAYFLHRCQGITDWHNALKLGYTLTYPPEILHLGFKLPDVVAPGTIVAPIDGKVALELGINPGCQICSGTTDSNSAFLAAVGQNFTVGTAVTSLGSTLALKTVASKPIFNSNYGIYSHRWRRQNQTYWLVGGASNTGGAVIAHFFSPEEIDQLSQSITPHTPTNLNYYPLLQPGERFPTCDPDLEPRLTPRLDRGHLFLQGILEGIAQIEKQGYDRLQELGAEPITTLYTTGGGAQNKLWTEIRRGYLGVPLALPLHPEAAYGSALLASTIP